MSRVHTPSWTTPHLGCEAKIAAIVCTLASFNRSSTPECNFRSPPAGIALQMLIELAAFSASDWNLMVVHGAKLWLEPAPSYRDLCCNVSNSARYIRLTPPFRLASQNCLSWTNRLLLTIGANPDLCGPKRVCSSNLYRDYDAMTVHVMSLRPTILYQLENDARIGWGL